MEGQGWQSFGIREAAAETVVESLGNVFGVCVLYCSQNFSVRLTENKLREETKENRTES
jgi:hypothetical protein